MAGVTLATMTGTSDPPQLPQPEWSTDGVALHVGDCLTVLSGMPEASFDSVVTDPPAGIAFMGRDWDSDRGGRDQWIAWLAERLGQAYRVLKPGGHALVWALPRTSHWTATALEDAGFEIRDCIVHIFGSGFPKSLNVAKAIDKAGGASPREQAVVLQQARERAGLSCDQVAAAIGCSATSVRNWEEGRRRAAGAEREYIVPSPEYRAKLADLLGYSKDERAIAGLGGAKRGMFTGFQGVQYGAAVTDLARRWEGWGTTLKPGQEIWWLARKPLMGTIADNVPKYGTGALNVDGCRVPCERMHRTRNGNTVLGVMNDDGWQPKPAVFESHDAGRWPTNLLFSHSASCDDGPCASDCPVGELDRQSGVTLSSGGSRGRGCGRGSYGVIGAQPDVQPGLGDRGGASRFFPVFRYEAKAPSSERPRLADGTAWPTVKSVALMRWLTRLVTRPGGRVLDLFAGSGATAEACVVEGFQCVLIERDPVAVELIKTRLSKVIQPDLFGSAC